MRMILGYKRGMTQIYTPEGTVIPVTVVEAGPCPVVQVKTPERDGYAAYQIGFGAARAKVVAKPQLGHLAKAGVENPVRHLREVRLQAGETPAKPGETITVAAFKEGELVDVVAVSKGRGYQGTVTRHHFSRGPASHGSMNVRQPGSLGQSSYPSRVFKGKRMSGHMGLRRTTVKNQLLVKIDAGRNLLAVRGQVPGPNGGLVIIRESGRQSGKGA